MAAAMAPPTTIAAAPARANGLTAAHCSHSCSSMGRGERRSGPPALAASMLSLMIKPPGSQITEVV
ncbi:hypothetical protein A5735_13260 [Mycolicibacter heraklionensis]|nr:hypothetical protein A5735_13260 [Mycolicibacter heraklionensis]